MPAKKNNFVYNMYDSLNNKSGYAIKKTNITKENGARISMREIQDHVKHINTLDGIKNGSDKFYVIANTDTDKYTLKSMDELDMQYDTITDYLRGRVRSTTKFTKINSFTVVMVREPKPKTKGKAKSKIKKQK